MQQLRARRCRPDPAGDAGEELVFQKLSGLPGSRRSALGRPLKELRALQRDALS